MNPDLIINPFDMQVLWHTDQPGQPVSFPCVDCGLITGNFCDGGASVGYDRCFAVNRAPRDYPVDVYRQMRTPLCSYCETCFDYCRFCRGVSSCTPATRTRHWSGVPQWESRQFTPERARIAADRLIQARTTNEQRDGAQTQ